MNEQSFLDQIRASPADTGVLQEYAQWLTENDDPRGEYLTTELDLRDAETRMLELQSSVDALTTFRRLDPVWLDTVFPLTVRSPAVGTFYAAPVPDEPPFVKEGDMCYPDTIIGIIETMSVFNSIPAGHAGVVSEVLATNGRPVDYGAPLVQLTRPLRLLGGG
jgi:uncharacterized protein (TIGR02996 family)